MQRQGWLQLHVTTGNKDNNDQDISNVLRILPDEFNCSMKCHVVGP